MSKLIALPNRATSPEPDDAEVSHRRRVSEAMERVVSDNAELLQRLADNPPPPPEAA